MMMTIMLAREEKEKVEKKEKETMVVDGGEILLNNSPVCHCLIQLLGDGKGKVKGAERKKEQKKNFGFWFLVLLFFTNFTSPAPSCISLVT